MLYSAAMQGLVWDVLKKMAGLTPPVFIMGGVAEDLLLGDELDRPHKDLDLLARRGELEELTAQLEGMRLGPLQVVLADAAGGPLMLRGHAGSLELEIYVALPEPGGFSVEVPAQGPAGRLRIFQPADTFDYPPARLDGYSIHTVSPLALAQMRAASAQTRYVADKRARDLAMLARLRAAFLSAYDDEQLQPRIEPV